jgi:microcystin-dependent protein
MAFSLLHAFQSLKADGGDATKVQPSNWNAEHELIMSGPGLIGRTAAATGPATEIPLTDVAVPTGLVCAYAFLAAPTGWLLCDGSAVSRATYAALDTLMTAESYKYGNGNGTTTFNVPDLRGRVVAGVDPTGTRLTATTMSAGNTMGATGGAQTESAGVSVSGTVTVGGTTSGSLAVNVSGTQIGDYSLLRGASGTDGPLVAQNGATSTVLATGLTSGTLTVSANGGNSMTGATSAVTNVQPTMTMQYIIKT